MTLIARARAWLAAARGTAAPEWTEGRGGLDRLRVEIDVRCPCGSDHVHALGTLDQVVDCARCSRRFAIAHLHYVRPPRPGVRRSVDVVLTFLDEGR